MTDPFGLNVYYRYNTNNQLAEVGPSVTDKDASYLYFKNGLLKQVTQGNGVYSAYTYDGTRLKTLNQKKADGTILNTYDYTTDNNGNISNRISNGSTVGFSYDKLNRIETSGQLNETYSYDQRGNRKTLTALNQVDSPAGTYDYDSRDQLTKVTLQDGRQVTYRYNGDGLLWERMENGVTTRYYNDGAQVIAEGTVSNNVATLKARYIRGNDLIAREDATKQKAYYLQNGHGDVTELRDATGTTRLNQYDYDIWGNLLTENETIAQPFKYSGELTDPTSKLQYLRSRWYDPSMGRFINKDTYEGELTNPLSLNLYTYVTNNPLRYIDPTGHANALPESGGDTSWDGKWTGLTIFSRDFSAGRDYVISVLSTAKNGGIESDIYWQAKSYLGTQRKWLNTTLTKEKYLELFDMAKKTGEQTNVSDELSELAGEMIAYYLIDEASERQEKAVVGIILSTYDGGKPNKLYNGIKNAPKYPEGFTAAQNGTVGNTVNNKELLEKLRGIEPGEWKKVYKDGYDVNGRKVSIHYFQSKSGKVFDVDVKSDWSNKSSK